MRLVSGLTLFHHNKSLPICQNQRFTLKSNSSEAKSKQVGIRKIQDIFRKNEERLYQWVKDRRVPAENNMAGKDFRPSVIAGNVSFGSQSTAGAETRSILMSILNTAGKRLYNSSVGT
jgi:hypothetical protein